MGLGLGLPPVGGHLSLLGVVEGFLSLRLHVRLPPEGGRLHPHCVSSLGLGVGLPPEGGHLNRHGVVEDFSRLRFHVRLPPAGYGKPWFLRILGQPQTQQWLIFLEKHGF